MKHNKSKSEAPIASVILWSSAALIMLAILTIYSAPAVVEELKTGRAYTLAAFFGDGIKVSENDSPVAFWMNVGLHVVGFAGMFIVSILLIYFLIIDYKKKRKTAESKNDN